MTASAELVAERFKWARENPTAEMMVASLKRELEPIFRGWMLKIKPVDNFGQEQTVYITYAGVPETAPELDALNANQSVMLSIEGGRGWQVGGTAPDKVKVRQFRGETKFRAKSGTPEKVVAYIISWFKKNAKLLKNEVEPEKAPTPTEMVQKLRKGLNDFRDGLKVEAAIGGVTTLDVYYERPPGIEIGIEISAGVGWNKDFPPRGKVVAKAYVAKANGQTNVFRTKSGTAGDVMKYIFGWFKKNKKLLTEG